MNKSMVTTEVRKFTPRFKVSKTRVANALKAERAKKTLALKQLNNNKSQLKEDSVQLSQATHSKLTLWNMLKRILSSACFGTNRRKLLHVKPMA
jgi:hypothetical protein